MWGMKNDISARKLDELDLKLLRSVIEGPSKSIIIDIIAPFLGQLSSRALRDRLAKLESDGLIQFDRTRASRKVEVRATRKGRRFFASILKEPAREA
jgi:DNA-binding Lrp family transcriptional regulator